MDFFMNSLYLATISTKICAYMKHMGLSEGFVLYNLGNCSVVQSWAMIARAILIFRTNIKKKNIEEPNGIHFIQHWFRKLFLRLRIFSVLCGSVSLTEETAEVHPHFGRFQLLFIPVHLNHWGSMSPSSEFNFNLACFNLSWFSLSFQFKCSHGPVANIIGPNAVWYFQIPFYLFLGFIRFCQWTQSALLQLW